MGVVDKIKYSGVRGATGFGGHAYSATEASEAVARSSVTTTREAPTSSAIKQLVPLSAQTPILKVTAVQ